MLQSLFPLIFVTLFQILPFLVRYSLQSKVIVIFLDLRGFQYKIILFAYADNKGKFFFNLRNLFSNLLNILKDHSCFLLKGSATSIHVWRAILFIIFYCIKSKIYAISLRYQKKKREKVGQGYQNYQNVRGQVDLSTKIKNMGIADRRRMGTKTWKGWFVYPSGLIFCFFLLQRDKNIRLSGKLYNINGILITWLFSIIW